MSHVSCLVNTVVYSRVCIDFEKIVFGKVIDVIHVKGGILE